MLDIIGRQVECQHQSEQRKSVMNHVQTHAARESFLARTWRILGQIDEAIHTTDLDLLYTRVSRLERELAELTNWIEKSAHQTLRGRLPRSAEQSFP
jgi:hypothetical protein